MIDSQSPLILKSSCVHPHRITTFSFRERFVYWLKEHSVANNNIHKGKFSGW